MKKIPIRMCILCRNRLSRESLLRLQYREHEIINYTYEARSFYLCNNCVDNSSKILKRLKNMFKQNNIILNFTTNKESMS
jgi:predicted RNA-binding protein YlxR (DUF448 family)